MAESNWRADWPAFRVELVDETARCFADQLSAETQGRQPRWDWLTSEQQFDLVEIIAGISLAESQAMSNLVERGVIV